MGVQSAYYATGMISRYAKYATGMISRYAKYASGTVYPRSGTMSRKRFGMLSTGANYGEQKPSA